MFGVVPGIWTRACAAIMGMTLSSSTSESTPKNASRPIIWIPWSSTATTNEPGKSSGRMSAALGMSSEAIWNLIGPVGAAAAGVAGPANWPPLDPLPGKPGGVPPPELPG
jgi:hypothetical protein